MLSTFKDFWKSDIRFEKKLSTNELASIRADIKRLSAKGKMSSQIIAYLQRNYAKLSEPWQAERAFWTEVKRIETTEVKDDAEELDIEYFIVMPNTNACPLCERLSGHGKKIFTREEMTRDGRPFPPFHPNCYCIAVPVLDRHDLPSVEPQEEHELDI